MKSSAKKIELASVDDLFSTEEGRQDAKLEKIQEIPLSELHPFKNHPFKVKDDEAMMETADSIKQYGVLVPAIARPDPDGGYELVAGHRRHRASELAEKETMPVIVRDLDDDAATIIIVNNRQDAEECVNDAYLGAWNAIPPVRPNPLLSYIVKIVRNISLKIYWRKEAAKRSGHYTIALEEIEGYIADQKTVEDEIEARELARIIGEFLDTLTLENRVIFMRRYWFADSYKDIAEFMGLSEKNISVRLTRIREKMKQYLIEREVFV